MEKGNSRFGEHLKSLRRDRRLTLERIEELSARLGTPVSKTYLSRCEHAQTHPTLPRLEALARLYKVRLGELAERFELEAELVRGRDRCAGAAPVPDSGLEPGEAAERGIEAANQGDPGGALILFDAARRLLPGSGGAPGARAGCTDSSCERPAGPDPSITSVAAEPAAEPAAFPDPTGPEGVRAARIGAARSRLCLAVLSGSVGNYHLCKEEAEALVCAEDLPEDIRQRASVQLAYAYRRLRRSTLSRLVVGDLLAKGESLPRRLQADAHFLVGTLDLDAALPRPALLHLRKAVALYRAEGARPDLCRALQELGEAYRLGGQLPEAMVRYQEAYSIARSAEIKSLISDLLSRLGRGHFLLGNHATGLRFLFESNDIARRGDYFDIQFRNFFYMRAIAQHQGDEFSHRTAERSLRVLLDRCDPFADEALQFRQELAARRASDKAASAHDAVEEGRRDRERRGTHPLSREAASGTGPKVPPRYRLATSTFSARPRGSSDFEKRQRRDEIVTRRRARQEH